MTSPDDRDKDKTWFCWLATRTSVEAQILRGFMQKDDKQRLLGSHMLADDELSLDIDALAAKYPLHGRVG